MTDEVVFAGSELECMRAYQGNPAESTTAGHFDPLYTRCCLRCNTNADAMGTGPFLRESDSAITWFVVGDTMWTHCDFVYGGTSGVAPILTWHDVNGFPWFAISGGNPGIKPQYNSGTGAAPVWTNAQTAPVGYAGSPDVRVAFDVKLTLGSPHTYEVYHGNTLVLSGSFTQAGFTTAAQVRITGNASNMYCSWSQILVTRNIPTVLAKVNARSASAAGTTNAWTGVYTDANEMPMSDVNFLTSAVVGDKFTFAWQDAAALPAGFGIRSVFTWSRAKISGAAPNNLKHVIRQGGVDYDSAVNVAGINYGLGPVGINWGLNSPGGPAWTKTIFDALEIGGKRNLMVAYRYTRITVDASNDGAGDILAQEIELRGTLGGADLTTAALAVARSSGSPGWYSGAEGPDKAFNDNAADWWQPRGAGSYIIWDHGAGTPQHVEQIRWLAHASFLGRTPNKFTIHGSNDLLSWTPDWAQITCGTWGAADRTFDRVAFVPVALLQVTKQTAYAALMASTGMVALAKQTAYAGMMAPVGSVHVAKQTAYAIMMTAEVKIAKQTAYVVMMPESDNRRMSLM